MTDNVGCKYFSEKMGGRDVQMSTVAMTESRQANGPRTLFVTEPTSQTDSINFSLDQRPWLHPHEIATLDPQKKIVFRRGKTGPEGQSFSLVHKVWVHEHPQLKELLG
jgi:hypothetical protein